MTKGAAFWSDQGDALAGQGRFAEALAAYDAALAANPAEGFVFANRGTALQALGRLDEALASHERAVALLPRSPEAQFCRGNCLRGLGRGAEALAAYDAALALRPGYAEAWTNRGNALLDLDRAAEAAVSLDKAVVLSPGNARAYVNHANALRETGALDAAMTGYARALALQPDLAEAHWNAGLTHLLRGEFTAGWRDYEWRKRIGNAVGNRSYSFAPWRGESLADRALLVHWEQGFGDTIQFCRTVPLLTELGARVLFAPQKGLAHLMRGLGVQIVDADAPGLAADYHVPLLSLPLLLGMEEGVVPAASYLSADPARVAAWKARLGDGFRIGICWQGATGAQDVGRSLPLKAFAPIAALPGVRLFSLHRGAGEAQAADLPQVIRFDDLDAGIDAFADTAALIANLDLVITSDTAVAHLAGALGAPVWVALKHVPDWRWLLGRDDSPWYPAMRLFRQRAPGDWADVFARIAAAVRERIA